MNTIARRLATAAVAAGIVAGAAATSAAPAHAWSGCEGDCVNAVTVTQRLETKSAPKLTFTTTVPTQILITFQQVGGKVAGAAGTSIFSSSHSFDAGPILTQGKGYVASIRATDQNGKSYTQQVSISALSRKLTLTISKVTITEDSDVGAGEIRGGFKAGNAVGTLFGERSVSATSTLTLNKVLTDSTAPVNAKVAVELQDDDADFGEFCPGGTGFSFTSGSTSCLDWTSQSIGVDVQRTPGSLTRNFSFTGSGRLKFTVTGTYTVTVG